MSFCSAEIASAVAAICSAPCLRLAAAPPHRRARGNAGPRQHLELTPENVTFALLTGSGGPLAIVPLQKISTTFHGVTSKLWRLPEHIHMPLADVIAARGVSGAELVAALLAAMRTQGMHWDRVRLLAGARHRRAQNTESAAAAPRGGT